MPNEQSIQSVPMQPSGEIYGNETGDLLPPEVDTTKRTSPVVVTSDAARVQTQKNRAELSRLTSRQIL